MLVIGEAVLYVDEYRVEFPAVVTNVFDGGDPEKYPNPGCNLAFVSGDANRTDGYGRQIERRSSMGHVSLNIAKANCWKRAGE